MIRLLLVDDQPVVRAGAARILGPDDGFEVVAECDDGDQVVSPVAAHRPDLVLMDVRMHRMDGVTAMRLLETAVDAPPVLMFTTFDGDEVLWGALDAGAAGFILRTVPPRASSPRPEPWRAEPPGSTRRWRPGSCRRSAPTCGPTWTGPPGSPS